MPDQFFVGGGRLIRDLSGGGGAPRPAERTVFQLDLTPQELYNARTGVYGTEVQNYVNSYRHAQAAINGLVTSSYGDLYKSAVPVTVRDEAGTGTTEITVATLPIPAYTLGIHDGFEIDAIWSTFNSALAKRLRGRFGGTVFFQMDLSTHLTFHQKHKCRNRGSLSSQLHQATNVASYGVIGSSGAQTDKNVDFGVDQVMTLTITYPVAGATGLDTILEECTIKKI